MSGQDGTDLVMVNDVADNGSPDFRGIQGRSDPLGRLIALYIGQVRETLQALPIEMIMKVARLIESTRIGGRKVLIFGNGGSAATATHFACDLCKGGMVTGKRRINAISLCDNLSLISAWANDTDYALIFAEQLENYAVGEGDVVIGISGSGNSPNVLNGIERAKSRGAVTVGFSGFDGGKLEHLVDVPVVVPNDSMEQVEDVHMLLEHVITTCVRSDSISAEDELVAQAMQMLGLEMEGNQQS